MFKKKMFLDQLTHQILQKGTAAFTHLQVVLPSERACIFLKNKLTAQLGCQTVILPQIVSISYFISELSGILTMNSKQLALEFYEVYKRHTPVAQQKDIEQFYQWAKILIGDFNEIDNHLVRPDELFDYLYEINHQKHWFLEEEKTELVKNYLSFLKKLPKIYEDFHKGLLEQGLGYQGIQNKKAFQNKEVFLLKHKNRQLIFAGFNALNKAEQEIMQYFVSKDRATMVWDTDRFFMEDVVHDASYFLKKYQKQGLFTSSLAATKNLDFYSAAKNIRVLGAAKTIGQVRLVARILEGFSKEKLQKTAVVLASEDVLVPLLEHLPTSITSVNVTMGVSLAFTPLQAFVNLWFDLQNESFEDKYHYKTLIHFLQNTYSQLVFGNQLTCEVIEKITRSNQSYFTLLELQKYLGKSEKLQLFFEKRTDTVSFLKALNNTAQVLLDKLEAFPSRDSLRTYVCLFIEVLAEFQDFYSQQSAQFSIVRCQKFLLEDLQNKKIDFRGEALEGLQIMGILETRCLDFENLILVGVNEGILPSGSSGNLNSFIPYDLKIQMGMPTFKEKEAIYAYYFYRLLQRTKDAYLIYNTVLDGLNAGEKSRFLQQLLLEQHPEHSISEQIFEDDPISSLSKPLTVFKTSECLEKIHQYAKKGFSPSAFLTYLYNPMAFYQRYVLGIKELTTERELSNSGLGTVIHDVLEAFYKPLERKSLKVTDIDTMLSNLEAAVTDQFKKLYTNSSTITGQNYISKEVVKSYLSKFLRLERESLQAGNKIYILQIEPQFTTTFTSSDGIHLKLLGKIDRIDRFNGTTRIIDYKTGSVSPSALKIKDFELLATDYTYSKALQLLIYSYMYAKKNPSLTSLGLEAYNISFKKLNQGFIPLVFEDMATKTKSQSITGEVLNKLALSISKLVADIFNPDIAFEEKEV